MFGGGTTATYTNYSIGPASSDRVVFVSAWGLGATARTLSSITIGGVTATKITGSSTSQGQNLQLYRATVPTGTTATIVVTWSGSYSNSGIDVWTASNLGTITTHSSNFTNVTANTQSVTINTPNRGFSIVSAWRYRGASISITNRSSFVFKEDRYEIDGNAVWLNGQVWPTIAVTNQTYTITYSAASSASSTTLLAASFSFSN